LVVVVVGDEKVCGTDRQICRSIYTHRKSMGWDGFRCPIELNIEQDKNRMKTQKRKRTSNKREKEQTTLEKRKKEQE